MHMYARGIDRYGRGERALGRESLPRYGNCRGGKGEKLESLEKRRIAASNVTKGLEGKIFLFRSVPCGSPVGDELSE